jgi:hypothetical protein
MPLETSSGVRSCTWFATLSSSRTVELQARGVPAGRNLASRPAKIKRYKGLSDAPQVKAKSRGIEAEL